MRKYVDLTEKVTATFYSEEYEEWTQQTVTIADILDSVCDEYTILPSAERRGEWIPVTNGRGGHECDQCHNYAPAWQTGEERLSDFCPNCGASMERGEEHETD